MVEKERRREGGELMLLLRLFMVMTALSAMLQTAALGKDAVYNEIGIIKGRVFITNNPELGRTPASGQYIVFQRMDCHQCLIGVTTDIQGKYMAFLGIGRYRVICTDPEGDRANLLRKGQVREIVVKPRPNDAEFNIELEIPKGR